MKTPSEPAEPRRPQDWSADEKIAAIFEAHGLDEAQLGGFLRQRGLHRAVLDEWRRWVFAMPIAIALIRAR